MLFPRASTSDGTAAGSAVSVSLRVSIAAPVDDMRGGDGFPGGSYVRGSRSTSVVDWG